MDLTNVPLVTKTPHTNSNTVIMKHMKDEIVVLTDFGNILRFPNVDSVFRQYEIPNWYNIADPYPLIACTVSERTLKQITLLTKALYLAQELNDEIDL